MTLRGVPTEGVAVAKKMGKSVRQPTRKPGIERYNRIVLAAEALILEARFTGGYYA
jgi:hypothetical protein